MVGHSEKNRKNKEFNNNCASLNSPVGEEGEGELQDIISCEDCSFENVEERIFMEQLHQDLEYVMHKYLSLFEREVLKLRYGWNDSKPMTRVEIQELFNLTSHRARDLEFRGLMKLRRTPWAKTNMFDWWLDGYIG